MCYFTLPLTSLAQTRDVSDVRMSQIVTCNSLLAFCVSDFITWFSYYAIWNVKTENVSGDAKLFRQRLFPER